MRTQRSDHTILETYASIEGIWNFEGNAPTVIAGTLVSDNDPHGKAGLGLRLQGPGGFSLDVSSSYDGIGDNDLDTITGEAVLRLPLNNWGITGCKTRRSESSRVFQLVCSFRFYQTRYGCRCRSAALALLGPLSQQERPLPPGGKIAVCLTSRMLPF
ncbi:MAG: hypothetical protein ACR2PG_24135 [Hyphomicrobiaceae bacterium]